MKPNWFVAVPVAVESWLPGLLRDLPESCRAFDAADVHMTVAFLGAMSADRVSLVRAAMNTMQAAPFHVRLGEVLALPSRKRPSALSLSVSHGREQAVDLIARWRNPLIAAAQARPDERPPLPHITVARPRRRADADGRRAALAWAERAAVPDVLIPMERIALYTWADDRGASNRQFQIVFERALT